MPQLVSSPPSPAGVTLNAHALLEEMQQHYVLSTDGTAASFLARHPELGSALLDASPRLREFVGNDPTIQLQAPFDDEGWQLLYAVVLWSGDAQQIYKAIDRFIDEWWIPNSGPAFKLLSFTYELV